VNEDPAELREAKRETERDLAALICMGEHRSAKRKFDMLVLNQLRELCAVLTVSSSCAVCKHHEHRRHYMDLWLSEH
jgi:hypothetical protein